MVKLPVGESSDAALEEAERQARVKLDLARQVAFDPRMTGTVERTDALLDLCDEARARVEALTELRRWWNPASRWRLWRAGRDQMTLTGALAYNERIRARKDRHVWVQP
jgi:hypothetical protein